MSEAQYRVAIMIPTSERKDVDWCDLRQPTEKVINEDMERRKSGEIETASVYS